MFVKFVFAILCGILYVIGLLFGWNYKEVSVYICIYLCPLICVFFALFTTYKAIVKKNKPLFIILNSVLSALYLIITIVIFRHYIGMPIDQQFNDCMTKLMSIAKITGLSYEAVNLLIYVVLLSSIIIFHIAELLFMNKKRNSTKAV